jgi:excisionase family DNA binding protein
MQAPAPVDEAVYTMAEAARLKGVSYHTISRAVRHGKIDVKRMGRQALIRASDLDAWIPMIERRPKRYGTREPDLTVRPTVVLPGNPDAVIVTRSLDRVLPVLAQLGDEPSTTAGMQEIAAALAITLGCSDAALIEWLPGNEGFAVRATTGEERDWISFQDAGPSVVTRPLRIAGEPVGLFAGIPDPDRTPLARSEQEVARGLLTLAAVAIVWARHH